MKKFQRILLASGLAATACLIGNSSAFAQAVTGKTATVNLSGTVPSSLTITVTPDNNASNLSLIPNEGYKVVKIATITSASTNSANGLKVTVTGTGKLVSGTNFISLIRVNEALGSSATSPSGGADILGSFSEVLTKTVSSAAGAAPDSSIFIGYSVPANQAPGPYTGSITFTATDN